MLDSARLAAGRTFFNSMKTYAEKLKDPRWQRKRLEIMERDGFKCRHCYSAEKTLNVHHKIYRKGKLPWDYEDEVFVTLCEECHQHAEATKEAVCMGLGKMKRLDRDIRRIVTEYDGNWGNPVFVILESLGLFISTYTEMKKEKNPRERLLIMQEMKGLLFNIIGTVHARCQEIELSELDQIGSMIDSAPENPSPADKIATAADWSEFMEAIK